MPSFLSDLFSESVNLEASEVSPYEPPHRYSNEKSSSRSASIKEFGLGPLTNGSVIGSSQNNKHSHGLISGGPYIVNTSLHSLPNGNRSSGSMHSRDRLHSLDGASYVPVNGVSGNEESGSNALGPRNDGSKESPLEQLQTSSLVNGNTVYPVNGKQPDTTHSLSPERATQTKSPALSLSNVRHRRALSASNSQLPVNVPSANLELSKTDANQPSTNRSSFPSIYPSPSPAPASSTSTLQHPGIVRLQHRHTLQVPKASTGRGSREFSWVSGDAPDDVLSAASPSTAAARRGSVSLARRTTRSIHSDMYLEEIPQDGEVARWTETVRQKRASRKKRKEEEEDDRVLVGVKVDTNHANWVTAYNMLTGIRFTVSRTNAKMDRELTDQDFDAKHKFSFDITGNELTPSARYDFKFKDYAPWVFRHLRANFKLDPADYLISLTSKYILSELGSPGKSGSFFYFSRDYKYIIKTIHHAEHKLLRRILREYYAHVLENPNTLISQFYGLHRVKVPYGRKIHFVVMNNLFPPHKDIHETFDLKGSTVGRDFKEEDLAKNPRATMKDLNWLRRNYHLEFGPEKKKSFIEQLKRDVTLLQRLKIMDYSLLVGIHDLSKGNEEKLRDKTLQVFHPGGERAEEPQPNSLARTPSKLENARKARELRQLIKNEKPVPMEKSAFQMPDEILEERSSFYFYSDNGGFMASHADGTPGEEIYYLGVIDCLTHVGVWSALKTGQKLTCAQYGLVKKAEHIWKGMSHNKHLISPIPPQAYGDRFIKFITGITMPREEAEKQSHEQGVASLQTRPMSRGQLFRTSTERVMDRAEKQARISQDDGANESHVPERAMGVVRSPSAERTSGLAGATLPIVEEVGEAGSTGGRSGRSQGRSPSHVSLEGAPVLAGPSHTSSSPVGGRPPPTPPKDYPSRQNSTMKRLPAVPLTDSPAPMSPALR